MKMTPFLLHKFRMAAHNLLPISLFPSCLSFSLSLPLCILANAALHLLPFSFCMPGNPRVYVCIVIIIVERCIVCAKLQLIATIYIF